MRSALIFGAAALALALAGPSVASTMHFKAHLNGASEVPANNTAGTGDVTASLDTATKLFSYKVTYKGLTGAATMAHFHGPAKAGANAPPIVVVADPGSPIGGEATLTDPQIADLKKGLWYFNVHTAANPGGEIRGQVKRDVSWGEAEAAPGAGQDLQGGTYRPPAVGISGQ
jgi:hypothetical protein